MALIQLLVTGDTEQRALVEALSAALPQTRDGDRVIWAPAMQMREPARKPLQPYRGTPAAGMVKVAQKMLEALGSKTYLGQRPDLVLAIGDVELHNMNKETLLVTHLRAALQREATQHTPATVGLLRARCAYHLLRPMVEASFFGDAATLGRAGVAPAHQNPPLRARDVEEFETVDQNPDWRSFCAARNAIHTTEPWWRQERHPPSYLHHLTRREGGPPYRKLEGGVNALRSLPWVDVIDTEPSPYLRALFDDLAAWFGAPSPLRPALTPAPLAPTHPDATAPAARLLRNL